MNTRSDGLPSTRQGEAEELYALYLKLVERTGDAMSEFIGNDAELQEWFGQVHLPTERQEFIEEVCALDDDTVSELRHVLLQDENAEPRRWSKEYARRLVSRIGRSLRR